MKSSQNVSHDVIVLGFGEEIPKESQSVTIQTEATKEYFNVVLLTGVLTFESVN